MRKGLRVGATVTNKKSGKLCIDKKETICSGVTESTSIKRITLDI